MVAQSVAMPYQETRQRAMEQGHFATKYGGWTIDCAIEWLEKPARTTKAPYTLPISAL